MGGDTKINNINWKELRKWMTKNFWEHEGVNSEGHEEWVYNLIDEDGLYAKNILIDAGLFIKPKEPINTHVEHNIMREYSVKYIYEYMGLNRKEFLASFRNGKKFSQKELLEKFFKAQEDHSNKVKNK